MVAGTIDIPPLLAGVLYYYHGRRKRVEKKHHILRSMATAFWMDLVPYIWGERSSLIFFCSGFIYRYPFRWRPTTTARSDFTTSASRKRKTCVGGLTGLPQVDWCSDAKG